MAGIQGKDRFDNKEAIPMETPDTAPTVTPNGTRERPIPGTVRDGFSFNEADLREAGFLKDIDGPILTTEQVIAAMGRHPSEPNIPGNYVAYMMRDPNTYTQEFSRLRELKDTYGEGRVRIVKNEKGETTGRMDNVMVVIDRAAFEARQQSTFDKPAVDFYKGFQKGQIGEQAEFDTTSPERLMQSREESHHQLMSNKTNWPEGMGQDVVAAEHYMGKERTDQIELEASMAGHGRPTPETMDAFKEFKAKQREREKSPSKGRKFSFPGSPTR